MELYINLLRQLRQLVSSHSRELRYRLASDRQRFACFRSHMKSLSDEVSESVWIVLSVEVFVLKFLVITAQLLSQSHFKLFCLFEVFVRCVVFVAQKITFPY